MTRTEDLQVKKKYQDYLVWLFQKINHFPKKQKFLLGERIGSVAMDILEMLISIQYSPPAERLRILRPFNLKLETLRELMRIAWRLKFISQESFIFQEVRIDEVGRMACRLASRHPHSSA